jgi:hypothetical protein
MKQFQTTIRKFPNRITIENIIAADAAIRNRILKALDYPPQALPMLEQHAQMCGIMDHKLFTTYDGINEQLTARTNTIPTILEDDEPIPKRVVFFEYTTHIEIGFGVVESISEVEVVVHVQPRII